MNKSKRIIIVVLMVAIATLLGVIGLHGTFMVEGTVRTEGSGPDHIVSSAAPVNHPLVPAEKTIEGFHANIHLFRTINNHHSPIFDRFFYIVRFFGSGWGLVPVFTLIFLIRRQKAGAFLLSVAITAIIANVIKQTAAQPRPAMMFDDVRLLAPLHGNSFPSADTATAFAIAVVLMSGERCWVQACLLLFAILVGYQRVYVGVHFPLDVTVGAVLGTLSALAVRCIITGRRKCESVNEHLVDACS